ncbi:MAG: hypothetical protein J5636_03810 [Clostridiales bacterium]|nr:hypothetical protein [Clostridiales bacterium]
MKLTNLNCPQCNGLLNQERDMFFCSSCGSAFAVDYDENDVKYAQLITEAERTKMMINRDVNVMQTGYVLREQVARNEQKRDISRQRKKAAKEGFAGLGMYIAGLVFSVLPMIAIGGYLVYSLSGMNDKMKENNEKRKQELYETVAEDTHFLENAVAGGKTFLDMKCQAPISDGRYDEDRPAVYRHDATIENIYLMKAEGYRTPYLLLVYRFTYEYEDTGEIIELFDCLELQKLELDEYGYMVPQYIPDFGVNGDMYFGAYFDKDQLIRECITGGREEYEAEELDFPDQWKEGRT